MHKKLIEQVEGILKVLADIEKRNGDENSAEIHARVLLRCLGQAQLSREADSKLAAAANAGPESIKN